MRVLPEEGGSLAGLSRLRMNWEPACGKQGGARKRSWKRGHRLKPVLQVLHFVGAAAEVKDQVADGD